ncbi:MAG: helix-turn-helix domain-containing protein [Pirellulales bacterium]
MTDSREIPHVRLGRCLRYPVRELEQWIDENKKGGE